MNLRPFLEAGIGMVQTRRVNALLGNALFLLDLSAAPA
jgi:hypothetical protein